MLKDRVLKFKAKIPRIHALRRLRVRTATIARAAGTPAVTYGVETCGMSDTHLGDARGVVARAAAPEGCGKDLNLVLLCPAGPSGTLDPAFDAHVVPIARWAQAWFEGWQLHDHLSTAFENAKHKVQQAARTM